MALAHHDVRLRALRTVQGRPCGCVTGARSLRRTRAFEDGAAFSWFRCSRWGPSVSRCPEDDASVPLPRLLVGGGRLTFLSRPVFS